MVENYFRDIKITQLSPEERKRVAVFFAKTGREKPRWGNKSTWPDLRKACGYVRVYNDDPVEAAAACVVAITNWQNNFKAFVLREAEKIPKEEMVEWWNENQDAPHPAMEEIYQNAERYAEKIMEEEFTDKIYQYLDKINGL